MGIMLVLSDDYKDLFQSLEGAVSDYTSGALDGYDKEDVAGLLEDRLATQQNCWRMPWNRCWRYRKPCSTMCRAGTLAYFTNHPRQFGIRSQHFIRFVPKID